VEFGRLVRKIGPTKERGSLISMGRGFSMVGRGGLAPYSGQEKKGRTQFFDVHEKKERGASSASRGGGKGTVWHCKSCQKKNRRGKKRGRFWEILHQKEKDGGGRVTKASRSISGVERREASFTKKKKGAYTPLSLGEREGGKRTHSGTIGSMRRQNLLFLAGRRTPT